MEWLYSLCAGCHNAIHREAQKMPLRHATKLILGTPVQTRPNRNTRKKQKRKKVKPAHIADNARKKKSLTQQNEELHAIFRANRERRERRWDLA